MNDEKMTEPKSTSEQLQPIEERDIKREMSESYIDYSMSIIIGRAIPDVRDGLKPVHRRILYSMNLSNFHYDKPHKKSARIVGDVLGKYHPHGDMSIYNALVRLAQTFSLRYPLINGQGNFGSIDGDPPAAMRYTEARLSQISNELFEDINKETVEMRENFDGSLMEPAYLPSKLPNLLINGTSGIAVGMSTNIPPHNLKEVGEAICAAIDIGPDQFQSKDVYKYIKGPDFPTGGIILGNKGILDAIETGKGSIVIRSKTEIIKEGDGKNKDSIIITELPYQVNKADLIEKIANLVNKGVVPEIADIRDESDRKGMQIYIALKKNSDPNACLNRLFVKTNLESRFSINNLALIKNGKLPQVLTYPEILQEFIIHRVIIIRKRTEFLLKKAKNRLHINEGLLIAINNIDEVVKLIKKSEDPQDARQNLIKDFLLSHIQAEAILKMPLSRLTNLQTQNLLKEKQALLLSINEYNAILADKQKIYEIIKKETRDLIEKYGDERRTKIRDEAPSQNLTYKETIPEEESVIILTENQIIKRMALSNYQSQKRGGKGKRGIKIREEDLIQQMFAASSHDTILLFTQQGRVYSIPAYDILLGARYSQGKALINYIDLKSEETITDITAITDFQNAKYLIFVTKKGSIKKTELMEFLNIRSNGIICMNLNEGDELVRVKLCNPKDYIFIPTRDGYAINFKESELRSLGRTAMGVRGIRFHEKNDEVVDLVISNPNGRILTITKQGYGKISEQKLYRLIHRAGKGVKNIKLRIKNDAVIASKAVTHNMDLLLASSKGILIRIQTKNIPEIGRSTKGVILMRFDDDDEIRSIALCESEEKED